MGRNSKSVDFVDALAPFNKRVNKREGYARQPNQEQAASPSWSELLNEALENEILPRVLSRQCARRARFQLPSDFSGTLSQSAVAGFVDLIIAEDMEQAREIADRVIVQTGSREALAEALLTPAARLLGDMWEQDTADFVTVTLCVYRLDQIMKESTAPYRTDQLATPCENRILLLPVPGEQHDFGLGMVADIFREAGWCVRSGPAVSRAKLLNLVRDEWFDVIGFSVSGERWLKGLSGCIRAVRAASCNPQAFLMAGGQAIADQPERARFLGVDATARDARDAFARANVFMENTVTTAIRQSNNRLTEFG